MHWTTPNINLATFIEQVRGLNHTGHYFRGKQLLIEFDISAAEGRKFEEEYLTSPYAKYDATKRTFIQLIKLAPDVDP